MIPQSIRENISRMAKENADSKYGVFYVCLEQLLDDEALEAAELQSKLLEMTEGIMEKSQK